LGENVNNALKAFGAKPVKFQIKSHRTLDASEKVLFKQRGGPIDIGRPSGDSVPAMLERGEYVLNRRAVAAIGKDKLDAINFGKHARFQKGGLVQALGPYDIPPIRYDPHHAGSNSHLHISMA